MEIKLQDDYVWQKNFQLSWDGTKIKVKVLFEKCKIGILYL